MISLLRVPTTALLFACLLLLGCEKDSTPSEKDSLPSDKTEKKSPAQVSSASDESEPLWLWRNVRYCRCCDGTTYCFIGGDKSNKPRLLWLVNGKSVSVDIDKDIIGDIYRDLGWRMSLLPSMADIHGGLYITGKKHLWYLRDGKISLVKETTVAEIKSEEHQVSQSSILWYFWEEYTMEKKAEGYNEGHDEGYEEGREIGREEGYEEGYGEGREADY